MSIYRSTLVVIAATAFSASVLAQSADFSAPAPADPVAVASKPGQISFRSVIGSTAAPVAQTPVLTPRKPIEKTPSSELDIPINRHTGLSTATGRVLVKFNDNLRVRSTRTPGFVLQTEDGSALNAATAALESIGGGTVQQAIDKSPQWLHELETRAEERSGEMAPDLAGFVYVTPVNDDLVACARAFNALPEVEFVVIEQLPSQAQQAGAQTGCAAAPGNGCQPPPGSINCNKPAITSGMLGPPPWGRCTNVIGGSVCSDDCQTTCTMGVDNFNCMKGCNDATCCGAITAILPACAANNAGWSGLCAMYANSLCNRTVYDTFLVVNGNPNSVPGSYKYDPCFALRTGPNPGAPDASVQANFMTALATPLPAAVNFPFELVQVTTFSVATAAPPPIGDSGNVTGVAATAANPSFLSSAKLAMQDPSFERSTYQMTPTCFTAHPGRKGCSNTPCCVYVCLVDPSCCISAWDSNCVRIAGATTNADNPCVQPLAGSIAASITPGPADFPTLNMASFPAGGATPNFASTEITTGFGKQSRNLQAWAVGAPVASSLERLENDPAIGLFAAAAPTSTAQLANSRLFLNSGFRGGGLDLAGFENAAVSLGLSLSAARGSGVTIGVIDNSAFVNHEELVGRISVEPGVQIVTDPSVTNVDPNHGTAVLGILLAAADGKGITGAAPNATGIFFPAVGGGGVGGRFFNALASAVGTLEAGDVICIPLDFPTVITDPLTGAVTVLQGTVLRSPEVFLLANVAAQVGISVVVAAGNECSPVVTAPQGGAGGPSIVVGACWPGVPRFPAVVEGLRYCRSEFSNFTLSGGTPGDNEVDVAGWGSYVTTCGYGDLWRGGAPTNPNRTYTFQFGGTSAASAMVAGCVARMQGTATALFGTPLPTAAIKNTVRANVISQCGLPIDSQLQLTSTDACAGDTVVGGGGVNSIRGFIDMGPSMASSLANQPFGSFPPGVSNFEAQVLIGKLLSGSAFSLRSNDSVWMKILSARPGQISPNPGFGPGLFYPPTALITDLLITVTTTFTTPQELFGLAVTASGQAQPTPNVYTIFFVYNAVTKRWMMLPSTLQFFQDTEEPDPDGDTPIASGSIGDLYNVVNLMDLSSGVGKIRIRAVTIAPPVQNSYQAWWDLISVEPNPPPAPPPPCWVARAVYGTSTPHWILFREWLDHHAPSAFRATYLHVGEPVSKWVAKSPMAKALIRPCMDAALRQLSEQETARALSRFASSDAGHRMKAAIDAIKDSFPVQTSP